MEIKIVDAKGEEKKDSLSPIITPTTTTGDLNLDQKSIGMVLGLETDSQVRKYSDNLKTLVEYAKSQTEDHSPESLKWVIRSLKANLGSAPFGEDNIKFIGRYCYLLNEERRLKAERAKFEKI